MTWDIICCPPLFIIVGIIGSWIWDSNYQDSIIFQESAQRLPCHIKVLQVFHDMPKRDSIKGPTFIIAQRVLIINIQIEMLFGKVSGLRILLYCFDIPSNTLHLVTEITCSGTNIQNQAIGFLRFIYNKRGFATQHIFSYPMIYTVHQSFSSVTMRYVIRSFIIPTYLTLIRSILGKDKSTF